MYEPIKEKYKPWPKSREELNQLLDVIEASEHDYNTVPDAVTDATIAVFNYMASSLGLSGFQASWADLNFIKRSRNMEGPFMLVDLQKALYPQYDLPKQVDEFIEKNKDWLAEEAQKRLYEGNEYTSPNVIAHWKRLTMGVLK